MHSWMEKMINKKAQVATFEMSDNDPLAELNHFFMTKLLSQAECPDPIAWFSVCLLLV